MMLVALLLLLAQDPGSVSVTKPADYHDRSSWPVIVDLPDGPEAPPEPGAFVITLKGKQDETSARASLTELKTRFRVDPERVVIRGCGRSAPRALAIAAAHPELFAAVVLFHPVRFPPPKKSPPCTAFLSAEDRDRARVLVALMILKKGGTPVEIREPGATFAALTLKPRANLQVADEMQRSGRLLDASLVCIALLDNPELASLARTKLKSIEGVAVIEMAKIEIAVSEKRYKDAYLRCKEAASQFAWLPPAERLRRRLAELEARPEVKKAMESED